MRPAIVIAAYDRPHCLKRLLGALKKAVFQTKGIPLVISIDKSNNAEVKALAEGFDWGHGEKRVVMQEEHLGLKAHILKCGDLTQEYESIVLLEDDLAVSPVFYDYAVQALEFYQLEEKVAGISLYSYKMAESCYSPFQAIDDGSDVYFMQVPSSWGQAWTAAQWKAFRQWFGAHEQVEELERLPSYVKEWSTSSWKKHFTRYLIWQEKYFIFPRFSFSTNFGDEGTNATTKGLYQVPLELYSRKYSFVEFKDSKAFYDSSFELQPQALNRHTDALKDYDYTIDLFGTKETRGIDQEYVLTVKKGKEPEKTFGMTMFPAVLNIIYDVPGEDIVFIKTDRVREEVANQYYHYYPLESIAKYLCHDEIERIAEHRAEEKANYIAPVMANEIAEKKINEIAPIRAQEIANDKFGEYVRQFHLNIDYPKISVVVATSGNVKGLERTLSSIVNQAYPNYELIVADREGDPASKEVIRKFSSKVKKVTATERAGYFEALQQGFEQCDGEYMTWIDPSSAFMNKAFWAVRNIFKNHYSVKWLTGIPVFLDQQGAVVLKPEEFSERWGQGRLTTAKVSDIKQELAGGNVFWRKSLWEQAGSTLNLEYSALADIALWMNFLEQEPLLTAMVYLAGHPVNRSLQNGWQQEAEQLQLEQARPEESILDKIFYNSYKFDLPYLRNFYPQRHPLPGVLKYDYDSDSFYISKS